MKKLLSLSVVACSLFFAAANAEVVGVVDFDKVVDNFARVKTVSDEISDKYAEIERFKLDKAREYKRLSTPLEKKNFEDATEKELIRRQEALIKLKDKKEAEIDTIIKSTIKQVAMSSNVDTVIEQSVVFFGGVDLTDKVIKALNGK